MTYYRKYPLVTCIVCTHNRPQMLPRALDSLVGQSLNDKEIIVIHDGPPQEQTIDICKEYAKICDDKEIDFSVMSTSEKSGYYCVPRNMALMHSRGDYIYNLDDDNAASPTALEDLVTVLEEGTVWEDFAYGKIRYCFNEGARRVSKFRTLPEGVADFQPWDEVAVQRLGAGPMSNFIDMSSFIAAKGAYWRLSLATGSMFNEDYRRFGDWELLARGVYFAGWRGKAVDKVVLDYYWHNDNIQLTRHAQEGTRGEVVKGA